MKIKNTERLTFRFMDETDSNLLFELDQDPAVMRYLTKGKTHTKDYIDNVFIPRLMSYRNLEKGWGLWQVNISDTDKFIGWILVRPMAFFSDNPEWKNIELGWRFKQESWGKGYAFEAAMAVKEALISQGNINHFSATAVAENAASINLMKKLGMRYVKNYIEQTASGKLEAVYYQMPV